MKILGCGANHRRAADVDVLDQFLKRNARLGGGLLEGVEIHDHHVDGSNAVLGHGGDVLRIFAAMQNPAVDLGMQSLDAAIEHFGKTGELGDVLDRHFGVAQEFCCAAGRDEFDAESGEFAGKIDKSGFVGDAKDGAVNFGHES